MATAAGALKDQREREQRETELQAIIKTQESKIQSLKREISLIKEQDQLRLYDVTKKIREQVKEKDQIIVSLRDELMKVNNDQPSVSSKQGQVVSNLEAELIKSRRKCEELERKLQLLVESSEAKHIHLLGNQSQLEKEMERCKKEKSLLQGQLQNMNRFYANALNEIPKRRETLLWVDNLIEFMSKSQVILSKEIEETEQIVKEAFKSVRTQIEKQLTEAIKVEFSIQVERQKLNEQLRQLVDRSVHTYKEALEEDKQFWELAMKERSDREKDQVATLVAEIEEIKSKWAAETADLTGNIKLLQNQKKTLLLGFQQLKSLNENRERNYRQELGLLKTMVDELLQAREIRERDYEEQISNLVHKIEAIGLRYHDGLQSVRSAELVNKQLEHVKSQLQQIHNNGALKKELQHFEQTIVGYLTFLNEHNSQREQLRHYVKNCAALLAKIEASKGNQEQRGKTITSESRDEEQGFETAGQILLMKQRQSKLFYELNVLKKHNAQLNEYCKTFEQNKGIAKADSSNRQIAELETQKDFLIKRCLDLELRLQELLAPKKTGKEQLQELVLVNTRIVKFLSREDEYIDSMSKSINLFNLILFKPVQHFDVLVKKAQQFHPDSKIPLNQKAITDDGKRFESFRQQYRELITRRNQNITATGKMVTELIKCIRETLPKHTVGARNGESSKIDTEKVITRQKTYPLERKLREVQGQKIKMREEMLARMKEVDTVVKSLELKYFKRFSNSANRFEEAVDKKLQDIASVLLPRQDNDQLLKISNEALADLHSKLKEAILQNEGLVKQLGKYISHFKK